MLKTLFSLLFCFFLVAQSQAQSLTLVGELWFPEFYTGSGDSTGGSDCWGWTAPDGTEYAIMGTLYGTHYVRVPDLTLIDSVFGAQNNDVWYHRDIKTWRNYAFIVGEMRGPECGVQVVDLSFLPDSVHQIATYKTAFDSTAHNLSIDTANARAYILKSDYSGCRIVDISDPANLTDIGFILTSDIHDVFARNDTAWIAEGNDHTYSIWYCGDPQNPVLLGQIQDNNFGYCHNIWPNANGHYFVTGEETAGKTVKIWDATDMANIQMVGEFVAPCSLVHNAHWDGDYIYCSHYESGVVVVDAHDPANPQIIHQYDSYPWSESGQFNGCWGVFPHNNSGYVYGSTIEGRLSVLAFDPLSASGPALNEELLGNPFPVPVNDLLTVPVDLKAAAALHLSLVDVQGREHTLLTEEILPQGSHTLTADMSSFPAGVYSLRLTTGSATVMRTIVVAH